MDHSDAVVAAEEAIAKLRELAAVNPGMHDPDLAQSLHELGLLYRKLDRPDDAVAPTEEAVALRRALAAADPSRYHPDLASSLHELGLRYAETGRRGDAVAPTEEAVALRRALAAADPSTHHPDLASLLHNLGLWLARLDRPGDAVAPTEEAVALRRALAAADPSRYHPDLAHSLHNLGLWLARLDRPGDAVTPTEELAAHITATCNEAMQNGVMLHPVLDGWRNLVELGQLTNRYALLADTGDHLLSLIGPSDSGDDQVIWIACTVIFAWLIAWHYSCDISDLQGAVRRTEWLRRRVGNGDPPNKLMTTIEQLVRDHTTLPWPDTASGYVQTAARDPAADKDNSYKSQDSGRRDAESANPMNRDISAFDSIAEIFASNTDGTLNVDSARTQLARLNEFVADSSRAGVKLRNQRVRLLLQLQRHAGPETERRDLAKELQVAINDSELGTQEYSETRWLALEFLDISPGLPTETRVAATFAFLFEIVRNDSGSKFARLEAARRLMDFSLSHEDYPSSWLYAEFAGMVAAAISGDAVSLSGPGAARALRLAQGLTAQGAYASLRAEKFDAAVLLLERGIGQLATQAVGFLPADHAATYASEHAETIDHFQRLSLQLTNKLSAVKAVETQDRFNEYAEVSALLKERARVQQEIEALTGAQLNTNFTLGEVTALARKTNNTVIYLAAIRDQGFALLVPGETEPEVKWLNNFNNAQVSQWIDDLRSSLDNTGQSDAHRGDIIKSIVQELRIALDDLPAGKLLVIPIGSVGRLPLQAALHASGDRIVCIAVNASTFESAYRRSRLPAANGVLAVADPSPCTNGQHELPVLPRAGREAEYLINRYGGLSLTGAAATKTAVIDQAGKPWLAVHLAVHGLADRNRPYLGKIFLSDGPGGFAEKLTVGEFRPQARIAVLASCWLGDLGQELPDEAQSFATALIESGCCGVLSALWPVRDIVTEEFVKQFYSCWLGCGLEPAQALARSQLQLEKLFPGETAAWQFSGC